MLSVTIEKKIAHLTLDHETFGNSFGSAEAKSLSLVLKDKKLRALTLTGAGSRFFCAGGNLKEQAQAQSPKQSLTQQKKVRDQLGALTDWPHPTVALINGDCFGGGTELLSCFDFVIAAPHVFFGYWQRKLGLSYGWGGGPRLANRMGHSLVKRTLDTHVFGAHVAREAGLIDAIAPSLELKTRGKEWIEHVLSLPSFKEIKFWDSKKETAIFEKLWMNPVHRQIVAKHGSR